MTYKNFTTKLSIREIVFFLLLLISGATYVRYIWNDTKKQEIEKVLQVAKSVEASLHLDHLKTFEGKPEDLQNPNYQKLKTLFIRLP
jgi:hypothetical protein